jgi:Trk K+ transport system NAD-binding subunit
MLFTSILTVVSLVTFAYAISVITSYVLDGNLEDLDCSFLPEQFLGKTFRDLHFRYIAGSSVIGFKQADGVCVVNRGGDTPIQKESKLFVLGNKEQIALLNKLNPSND